MACFRFASQLPGRSGVRAQIDRLVEFLQVQVLSNHLDILGHMRGSTTLLNRHHSTLLDLALSFLGVVIVAST